ncbi:hypothetical protein ACTXGU_00105 [Niallia sp. 01092]|uniref:hypothetical protein n=1 Tax=Niallia sp. 01092 TaxID=3457759 RepID=UPI003FD69276
MEKLTQKELKEKKIIEHEELKQRMIKELDLHPIDEFHDDYYCDYKNQKIYSFKNLRFTDMKFGTTFSGYKNVSLMRNDGKQKTYNRSWIFYSSFNKVPLMSWRQNGEKGTIHHINSNKKDDSPENLECRGMKEQMDDHWKEMQQKNNKKQFRVKFSDEHIIKMFNEFKESGLKITRFCTLYCEKYQIDPVHMYNILRRKARTNLAY